MKKCRLFFALLLSGMVALSFSACSQKENALQTINLNEVVHSIFYAPQYVAIEKGFFEAEGLAVNVTTGNGADKSMTAIISGEADIALLGTEAGIYVYNEGKEDYAIAFAQLTQRAGNFLVSRENEKPFDWENLVGKTIIGGREGGMPQMVLEYVLLQKGLVPGKDVEILTNLQFTSTAGAFTGGVGDYTAEFDPSALALETNGAGYVVASLGEECGIIPYTVYMATKSYVDKNSDTIQKFTNAVYQGQQWVESHSAEEIAEVIAPHFKESSMEDLVFMVERYKNQDTWRSDPLFDEEAFGRIQDIMEQGGQLSKRVPFGDIVNNSFAEKAVEKK